MFNPYEPPLTSPEPEAYQPGRLPLWRRTGSFAIQLLGYVFGIFAAMLSLTWTIEALKPNNAPLESSLWIAAGVSLTVGGSVLWIGTILAKRLARHTSR